MAQGYTQKLPKPFMRFPFKILFTSTAFEKIKKIITQTCLEMLRVHAYQFTTIHLGAPLTGKDPKFVSNFGEHPIDAGNGEAAGASPPPPYTHT